MAELLLARPEDLGKFEGQFQDDRLDEMLFRFRGRNHLELFDEAESFRWRAYCSSKWSSGVAIDDIERKVSDIELGLEESQARIITELRGYLDQRRADLTGI